LLISFNESETEDGTIPSCCSSNFWAVFSTVFVGVSDGVVVAGFSVTNVTAAGAGGGAAATDLFSPPPFFASLTKFVNTVVLLFL